MSDLEQEQREADLHWLMDNAAGRRFVWRMLGETGLYQTSFAADPVVMGFNEGRRDVGRRLLSDVTTHEPDKYLTMIQEAQQADQKQQQEDEDDG